MVAASCETSSTVTTGPSAVKCEVTLTASPTSIESGGGGGTVSVATQPECAWTASSEVSWISGLSPASGQGSSDVSFRVAANPLTASRQGDILVNAGRVRVQQAAGSCRVEIEPRNQQMSSAGGTGSVTITPVSGCAWTATSQASWISLTQPSSGEGNGTLGFTVASNPGSERVGTVSVADQTFSVTQATAGSTLCQYTLDPTDQSVEAAGRIALQVRVSTANNCSWTANSNATWIVVASGTNQQGPGVATLNVSTNSGAARVGTVAIAGRTFTVSQAMVNCTFAIAPTAQSVPVAGGAGSPVSVTTSSVCAWTATSNVPWLTIASGASGTGNGSVGFTASANTGGARSGTLTIAGQAFTVNQAAAPCNYSISPTNQSVAAAASTGTVSVTAGPACTWTATSNAAFLTITSGASGTGNGSVGFTVAANTGGAQNGTLTIAGQTFTVSQAAAPCTYTISPTSQSVAAAGGAGTVSISTACAWTASRNVTWLTITSGESGTGNGTVNFTVSANTGAGRSGTITIGGQTFTVNQVAAACTFTIAPTSQSVNRQGSNETPITVTTASHCAWTATSNVPAWITVTSGASGSGNGTVQFNVSTNTGAARSGTLTVAGRTATVNQN
jgi:hypothetical protein